MTSTVFPEKPGVLPHVVLASVLGIVIGALTAFSSVSSPSGFELPGIVIASLVLSVMMYYIMARLSGRSGLSLIVEVFLIILVSSLATWIVAFDIVK